MNNSDLQSGPLCSFGCQPSTTWLVGVCPEVSEDAEVRGSRALTNIVRGQHAGYRYRMTTPFGNITGGTLQAQLDPGDSIRPEDAFADGDASRQILDVTGPTRSGGGDRFIAAYVIVVNSMIETLYSEIARARGVAVDGGAKARREEICAAVWSSIRAALAASLLSSRQQQFVLDALTNRLHGQFSEGLCSTDGVGAPIRERAAFYLQHVDPYAPVTTAVRIVEILLEATAVPQERRALQTRLLAGLIAHRIVSDVSLFNGWESQGKLGPATGAGK